MRPKRSPVSRRAPSRDEADDAAGDEAGDLHHGEAAAVGEREDEAVALVVLARLVEGGVEEAAGVVGDAGHLGRASGARFTWQSKTFMKMLTRVRGSGPRPSSGGGGGRGDRRDDAVGGADDQPLAGGRHARRIAEEVDAPDGEGEADRREEAGDEEERQRRRGEAGDEALALAVHGLDYTRKQRHRPSHSPLACGGDGIFTRPEQYRSAARIRPAARTGRRRRCGCAPPR